MSGKLSPKEWILLSRERWLPLGLAVLFTPAVLILSYRLNPTLSHSLAETFSVVVACSVFMLTWNARDIIDNHYFIFLGIAYLFVGIIDYLHVLSFGGVFTPEGHTISIELWFAARFVQSFALLIAPFFVSRKTNPWIVLSGFTVASAALVTLAWTGAFPDYYIPGKGLTSVKGLSDYLVAGVQVLAIGALWRVRSYFDRETFQRLVLSILFSIIAELSAELYTDVYIYNSVIGHYLKVVSFYLVYKAIVATGLVRPYDLLFRNLKRSEEDLRVARDGLESRVAERTAELQAVNERLEKELAERQRAVEMRQLILDLHHLTHSVDNARDLLASLTSFLQERFGFKTIGIRYHRGVDFPYFETRGFPREFVETEMSLCSADRRECGGDPGGGEPPLACLCGKVIAGRCDPSLPFFTPYGTFWTNGASELLAADGSVRNIATRGRCVREGYESIALVPLRLGDITFGLLQFNDRRKGMFHPNLLAQFERVAENVAVALSRLLSREELKESEDQFRLLLENSSVGIFIVLDGRIVFRNSQQERIFGKIPDGFPFRDLGPIHPDDVGKFERLCDAGVRAEPERLETDVRFLLPEGVDGPKTVRWIHCQTNPIRFQARASLLVDMVDITRLKELEQTVITREKLASLGQLAAGIAHEIRNPLSGININVSTLDLLYHQAEGLSLDEKEKVRAVIHQTKSASERISRVVKRVMEFSKPAPPRMERIDLNRVVRDALALSVVTIRKDGVSLREALHPEPLPCLGDAALLEQVVLNLVTNALQAMRSIDGDKHLTVITAADDGKVVLRVDDSGPGVPEHLREKVFDPFYTTRKDGHGIGLSFSYRVVLDHNGSFFVGNSESGGAEFRVELPIGAERGTG